MRGNDAPQVIMPDALAAQLSEIDASVKLDAQSQEILQLVALEFVESSLDFSCKLANHRDADTNTVEVNDLTTHLEHSYAISVLGHPSETSAQLQRISGHQVGSGAASSHRQTLALKRKFDMEQDEEL